MDPDKDGKKVQVPEPANIPRLLYNWKPDMKRIAADRRKEAKRKEAAEAKGELDKYTPKAEASHIRAMTPREIQADMCKMLGDWPKRVSEALFVIHNNELRYLKEPGRLFSWIQEQKIQVDWKSGRSMGNAVTKKDYFDHLHLTATGYEGIETVPHYPEQEGVFYHHDDLPTTGYEGYVNKFLEFFKPSCDNDYDLLKALVITPLSGVSAGARPGFVLMGPDEDPGRGVGKTMVSAAMGQLYDGFIEFSKKIPERELLAKRVLSSRTRRIIRIDNIKGRLSSDDLESLITTDYINGHLMWFGDHRIPNFFTWILTLNQPEFSADLAERALPIRILRPTYNPKWWPNLKKFIKENRLKIQADAISILKGANINEFQKHLRFAEYSEAVLQKTCRDPNITAFVKKRQKETDDELNFADTVKDCVYGHMAEYRFAGGRNNDLNFDPTKSVYRIRQSLLTKWICEEYHNMTPRRIIKYLKMARPKWLSSIHKVQDGHGNSTWNIGVKDIHWYVEITEIEHGTKPKTELGLKRWKIDNCHRRNRYISETVAPFNNDTSESGTKVVPLR